MPRPPRFNPNPLVSLVTARLRLCTTENPIVTDEHIASVIGKTMEDFEKWRSIIDGARRFMYRHEGKLFIRPRGQHIIKLAEPSEWVDQVQRAGKRVRRSAYNGAKMASLIDRAALHDGERKQLDLQMSALSTIAFAMRPSTLTRIEAAVATANRPLAIGNVLQILQLK